MKEKYMKPVLEITRFEAHDVITASVAGNMTESVNLEIEQISSNVKIFEESMK